MRNLKCLSNLLTASSHDFLITDGLFEDGMHALSEKKLRWSGYSAVSYTHLTLPTIYSV